MKPLDRVRLEKAAADCGFELTPFVTPEGAIELHSAAFPESVTVRGSPDAAEVFTLTTSSSTLLDAPAGTKAVRGYGELYAALLRASAIARTMPNRVANKFRAATANLPRSTEVERIVLQRVGQDFFREALLDHWQGRCCVTGLMVPGLLRASHIKPWARCVTDDERLDVFNGLLLAPHVDALFDGGWISFSDEGSVLISSALPEPARAVLGVSADWALSSVKPAHASYLAFHRQHEFRNPPR